MGYTEDFKENALRITDRIGVIGASRETGVNAATLRKWRRKAKEKRAETEGKTVNAAGPENPDEMPVDPLEGLSREIRSELEEMRKLNDACRQTIAMLAEENVTLRKQCEDYLRAIALIAGSR